MIKRELLKRLKAIEETTENNDTLVNIVLISSGETIKRPYDFVRITRMIDDEQVKEVYPANENYCDSGLFDGWMEGKKLDPDMIPDTDDFEMLDIE